MILLMLIAPLALAQCPCEYESCADAAQAHAANCASRGLVSAVHVCVHEDGQCPIVLKSMCTIDGFRPEAHIDLGPT
jgi:hypothetical protein